jgi:predicted dinucleotide-binding enzyme
VRIGILGSGLMGSALGTLFTHAGHSVAFSYSRDSAKLEALAHDAGSDARAASPNEAVRASELVLVSIPWHRLDDAIAAAGGAGAFATKIVLTCSLPMLPDDSDLAIAHDTSGAEELARRLPNGRVVAAFNTIPSELLRVDLIDAVTERGRRPHVVMCGDDEKAKGTVDELAEDVGFRAIDAGALRVSRWIEPFGLLVGQLAYAQELGPELGYRFIVPPGLREPLESANRRPG